MYRQKPRQYTLMTKTCSTRPSFSTLSSVMLGLALLAAAGCSSVKTNVDEGVLHARTFSFLDTGTRQAPNYAETSQQAYEMVKQALMNNLAAKGLTYTASGGDVTAAYLIIVGNNATTTSLNNYFGYTPDSAALASKVHKEQTSDSSRGYFESGTLVIDLLDPKTSKLLQRRSITAKLLRNLPLESRTARVQAIVDQALNDVRIAQ